MATIVRYNIDGTDLVQDASASLLLWLPRFPLKLAWNLTQVSAIKDRRLTDMGPSLCWTVYLWPDKQHSVCAVGPVCQCLATELQMVPPTGECCCLQMQRHGMSRYSANPELSAWHTMHPLRLCRLCATWGELSQISRVTHVIWFVTSVTCNACDLVCDEFHVTHVIWFLTSVTCKACDLGLWRVSHVTCVIWFVTSVTCDCDLLSSPVEQE